MPFVRKKHDLYHYLITILMTLMDRIVKITLGVFLALLGVMFYKPGANTQNIILSYPTFIISAGILVNSVFSVFLAIFSLKFNKGMCPVCNG
ncbi:hypothetical protein HYS93_00395 [Candidatus Daviesbacteria bacterium]|nr:hypothetical protein [Candidatus Daviesbacteria bacterium]